MSIKNYESTIHADAWRCSKKRYFINHDNGSVISPW